MLIFLDCDGVINQVQENFYIDKDCLKNICSFTKKSKGKIILISTWRLGFLHDYKRCTPQIQHLRDLLSEENIEIYSRTNVDKDRYTEIQNYLNKSTDKDYIIIDDDKSEYKNVEDNHIFYVDAKTGFTKQNIKEALKCI